MIYTERLVLRDIEEQDKAYIFKGLSDPQVFQYYGVSYSTLEETMGQMKWYQELEEHQTGKWWAICDRAEGTFYGGIGFNDWEHQHRKAEIGYWLLSTYWGKGLISEAVPAACQYAQDQMNLHRIEAYIERENLKSKRVVEKFGFQYEGTMIDYELKNGTFIDMELYALLSKK